MFVAELVCVCVVWVCKICRWQCFGKRGGWRIGKKSWKPEAGGRQLTHSLLLYWLYVDVICKFTCSDKVLCPAGQRQLMKTLMLLTGGENCSFTQIGGTEKLFKLSQLCRPIKLLNTIKLFRNIECCLSKFFPTNAHSKFTQSVRPCNSKPCH